MDYILICAFLYLILIVTDLIPLAKRKEWKALSIAIPVYAATLILNVLIGLGVKFPSLAALTKQMMPWL